MIIPVLNYQFQTVPNANYLIVGDISKTKVVSLNHLNATIGLATWLSCPLERVPEDYFLVD